MFVGLMAMVLLLASMLMNVGGVAALRVDAANAADAGALAAASYISGAQNAVVRLVEDGNSWLNRIRIDRALMELVRLAPSLEDKANVILKFGWIQAQYASHLVAWENANLDPDPNNQLEQERKKWRDKLQEFYEKKQNTGPFTTKLEWNRAKLDPDVPGEIDPTDPCRGNPTVPCKVNQTHPSYSSFTVQVVSNPSSRPTFDKPTWTSPKIDNGDGTITVTVMHHRNDGGLNRDHKTVRTFKTFWLVRYPPAISSSASASYRASEFSRLPIVGIFTGTDTTPSPRPGLGLVQ